MINNVKTIFLIVAAFVCQFILFPAYLEDPFQPNLLLIMVVYMGLRISTRWGYFLAFLLGMAQDSFSGVYMGLHSFSFLLVFILLNLAAHRLYTDSRLLIILVTFLATFISGFSNLLLLLLFSAASGIYNSFFYGILPQGIMNALMTLLTLPLFSRGGTEARP